MVFYVDRPINSKSYLAKYSCLFQVCNLAIRTGNQIPVFTAIPNELRSNFCYSNIKKTRNSSGDEIANVNFLYDNSAHALKCNRLVQKFCHQIDAM